MVTSEHDKFGLLIPVGSQMLWYGGDENPTRTGSDAQTSWAQVNCLTFQHF